MTPPDDNLDGKSDENPVYISDDKLDNNPDDNNIWQPG
jgi:hypothetical protein